MSMLPSPDPPERPAPPTAPSSTTVVVLRAPASSGLNLEERLRRWRARGWQVRRHEPRVVEGVEGPTYGVLLVLERDGTPDPRPQRRPIHRSESPRASSARKNATSSS